MAKANARGRVVNLKAKKAVNNANVSGYNNVDILSTPRKESQTTMVEEPATAEKPKGAKKAALLD